MKLYARTMVIKSIYETRRLYPLTAVNERYSDFSPKIKRPIFSAVAGPGNPARRLELIEAEFIEFL